MAAYQKCGVIIVTVIFAILEKIKSHNYRIFIVYEENGREEITDANLTRILNNTDTLFEGENVSRFLFRCLLVSNCIAVLPCIYLTSWSDRHGRKLLLMLPYVGSIVSDIVMLAVLFIPETSSKMLLIAEAIDGFLGGTILISLGCLCYITDSTDHRQRTLIIAVYFGLWNTTPCMDMAFQYFWTPVIGLSLHALILCAVVYRMVFAVCFLVYIKFCVSESVFLLGTFQGNPWTNLLTPINVSEAVNCIFKRRLDNMRFYIILLTTIFILYTTSLFGNIITFPSYFRTAFLWSFKDVLTFSALFTLCQTFTLWFCTYLAIEFGALDTDLGMYGCASLAISCLVLTLSQKSYIASVGAFVGIGSLFVPVTIVAVLSKLVERNETGSIYAGVGFLILMTEIISAASYEILNNMCQAAGIPQAIFLLSFGLISFCLFFFIYLKRNISPHLLGFLNGNESLSLINRKGQVRHLFEEEEE